MDLTARLFHTLLSVRRKVNFGTVSRIRCEERGVPPTSRAAVATAGLFNRRSWCPYHGLDLRKERRT